MDAVLTATDFHQYHELEQSTIIRSGRNFFGEVFDQNPTHTIPFQVPDILRLEPARLEVRLMGRSVGMASPYTVSLGDSLWTILPPVTASQTYVSQARVGTGDWLWTPSSELVQVGITLDAQVVDAKGWLDYVRITGSREANMSGGSQQEFVRAAEAAPGRIVRWNVGGAQSVQRVWDVTDPQAPRAIPHEVVDGVLSFQVAYDEVRRFRAGTGSGFYAPVPIGPVQTQMSTRCPRSTWWSSPRPLCARRRTAWRGFISAEGLDVAVLEPSFIYDCFSSGRVDPTAIKMLMKMLHDRADGNPALEPRYLQLFGDGTFRNRNLPAIRQCPHHLPECPKPHAHHELRDGRLFRLPVRCGLRALDGHAVHRRRSHSGVHTGAGLGRRGQGGGLFGRQSQSRGGRVHHGRSARRRGGQSIRSLAQPRVLSWRTTSTETGGDGDRPHALQHRPRGRGGGEPRRLRHRAHLHGRLPATGDAGGERYPEAEEAIDRRVRNGALLVNYIGHGGERGWAHERVLNTSTIQAWDNLDRMPLFFTATCELARFDDPDIETAGEMMVMNPNGGAIAMMTTTRVVYSFANEQLNTAFFDVVFDAPVGTQQRLGDILRRTKNNPAAGASSNKRNFTLLGDVALQLATPGWKSARARSMGSPSTPGPIR